MLKREDIRIRDPFILVDNENKKYYMYGTTCLVSHSIGALPATHVYVSEDLENFEGPIEVFNGNNFWADRDYWASEVHKYKDKYYMFISLKSESRRRATQILVCDKPDGRFVPLTDSPITPEEWECLDGTLWVEDGKPYVVFCHEWIQIANGGMCVAQLSDDLTHTVGDVVTIFHALDNPLTKTFNGEKYGVTQPCAITDGPFLYQTGNRLNMIWSTSTQTGYAVLKAYSDNGILGEWKHDDKPVFSENGGHAMLFTDLNGNKKISLHQPNDCARERAQFLPFEE